MVSGSLIVISPFAATSHLGMDITGSYHVNGADSGGVYVEGGASFMALFIRDYEDPLGAIGPVVGVGIRSNGLGLGARISWLPPILQAGEGHNRNVFIGVLTLTYTP